LIRPITSAVVDKMFAAFLVPQMDTHLSFLDSQLETSPDGGNYLCGAHLTAADMLMSFPVMLARERVAQLGAGKAQGKLADKYPRVWAYLKRLEDEPGYKKAEARIKEVEEKAK
jgi:glutathione S-transferase